MPNALQIHLGGRGGVPRGKQVHYSVADGSTFWSRSSPSSATCGRYGNNTVLVRNGTERKPVTFKPIIDPFGPRRVDDRQDDRNKVGLNFHFRLVQGVSPSMQAVRFCRCIVKMRGPICPWLIPRYHGGGNFQVFREEKELAFEFAPFLISSPLPSSYLDLAFAPFWFRRPIRFPSQN